MAYYSSKLWGKKKTFNIEAFIAPANFDPSSQPLNIVTVFGDYDNANKAYIYSFTSAIATLTLPVSSGITYRWGETISGVDYVNDVVSGTAFTAGSTKRYVIVNSTATSLSATVKNGGIWLYASEKIYSISSTGNNSYLKYIHCQNLHSLTTIGTTAFYNNYSLTGTLTIPDTITSIGQNAFQGCRLLTGKLMIPDSVTTINGYTFVGCTGFTGLTLSNSLTTLGDNVFYGCTGMNGTLTIPASIRTISETAFIDCGFNHIENYSNEFLVEDEVLYTAATITALYSAKGYSGTLTLKTNTTRIGYSCFYNNNLRTGTLTIPNTVTTIGVLAFVGCVGLTGALIIPNSVTEIAGSGYIGAFQSCTGFTSLTLAEGLLSVGKNAFNNCSNLTGTLTIPNSVTTIGANSFYNCKKFNGIATIGSGITTLGVEVFSAMSLVTEWHILSQVAPSVQLNTWANYARPLHVKIGATGYNVAPFTDTTIFSSIIYDL